MAMPHPRPSPARGAPTGASGSESCISPSQSIGGPRSHLGTSRNNQRQLHSERKLLSSEAVWGPPLTPRCSPAQELRCLPWRKPRPPGIEIGASTTQAPSNVPPQEKPLTIFSMSTAGGETCERYLLCSSKMIFFSSSVRDQLSSSAVSNRRAGGSPELSIAQPASALSSPRLWQPDLKHLPKARNTQQLEDWGGNVFLH